MLEGPEKTPQLLTAALILSCGLFISPATADKQENAEYWSVSKALKITSRFEFIVWSPVFYRYIKATSEGLGYWVIRDNAAACEVDLAGQAQAGKSARPSLPEVVEQSAIQKVCGLQRPGGVGMETRARRRGYGSTPCNWA